MEIQQAKQDSSRRRSASTPYLLQMKHSQHDYKETGKTRPPKNEMSYYEAATRWKLDERPRPSF